MRAEVEAATDVAPMKLDDSGGHTKPRWHPEALIGHEVK
jgi:hypothetical protein